jgi:hypothetical protein
MNLNYVEGKGVELIRRTVRVEVLSPESACSGNITKEIKGRGVMELRKNRVKSEGNDNKVITKKKEKRINFEKRKEIQVTCNGR